MSPKKSGTGARVKMVQTQDKNVTKTDIGLIMICVAHSENSVDKEQFCDDKFSIKQNYQGDKLDILKSILL